MRVLTPRNATAAKLLDLGFANYATYSAEGGSLRLPVQGGVLPECELTYPAFATTVGKGKSSAVEAVIELPEALTAPVVAGDTVGQVIYRLEGVEIGRVPITVTANVEKIGYGTLFSRLLAQFLLI